MLNLSDPLFAEEPVAQSSTSTVKLCVEGTPDGPVTIAEPVNLACVFAPQGPTLTRIPAVRVYCHPSPFVNSLRSMAFASAW